MRLGVAAIPFVVVLAATTVSAHGHGHGHDHDHDDVRRHGGIRGRELRGKSHRRHVHGVHPDAGKFKPDRPPPPGPWSTWQEFEDSGARCKTPDPTEAELQASDKLVKKYKHMMVNKGSDKDGRELQTGVITVKTYFHILDKRITQNMIDAQKTTLMNAFISTGTNFRFVIDDIQYQDTNPSGNHYSQYMTGVGSPALKQENAINVQTAHRLGDKSTCNVFFTELEGNLLGFARLPGTSSGSNGDGIFNLWSAMNGGPSSPYNEGDTLVHEMGHWLGLYHTFQGGCTGSGDIVADTPREATAAYGCPTGRDTCAGGGPDPITNFMDYTEDSCTNEFTSDQNNRMVANWNAFRSLSPPPPPTNCVDDPPGWYDSFGDDCDWYADGNNCAFYGSDFESPDFGTTAIDACCICGGGKITTPPSPTNPPPTNPPPTNPCDSNPCQNGGQCSSSGSGYTCNCSGTGFTGDNCQTNINDCTPTSCANGGACMDGINGFTCQCAGTGFTGTNCQTNIDDCTPMSCANGGICIDGVNSFTCNCENTGYEGPTCGTPAPQPTNPPPMPPTYPPGQKGAVVERWLGVLSNDPFDRVMLDSLKRLQAYPDSPDESGTLQNNILETPSNIGDDYGLRLRTYFVPPVTGLCHFYLASDDNGELWLSPNANRDEVVLIASVVGNGADGWTLPRQWFKYPSQKSPAINLVEGEVRYLEAIMKEGGGGDNLAIGWECPGLGLSLDVISTDYTVLEPPNGPAPPTPTAPAPQPTNPPPAPPTAFPPGQKGAAVERWLNVPYNDGNDRVMLDSLKRLQAYPDSPDEAGSLQNNILETPSNQGNDFGLRLWTYFVPPVTGRCHFYLASDDNGELRLSPNANPSEVVLISSVVGNGADGWTLPRQWFKYSSQKSIAIDLVEGEVRYLEAIMKEGGGGDNLAIGWECPGLGLSLDVISTDYTVLEPPNGPSPPTAPPPAPQPTNPPPAPPTEFPPGQKGAAVERWLNVPYNDGNDRVMLDSLKRLQAYPDSPDEAGSLQNNILETPSNQGNDFGLRLWTYFVPPVTGRCHFYLASDDNAELRLSPNANRDEAVLISSVVGNGADGWTLPRQWFKYPSQKSPAIDLVEGEVRYLEAIMKEGGGGDNLAIGWECPGLGLSLDVISTDYTVLAPP